MRTNDSNYKLIGETWDNLLNYYNNLSVFEQGAFTHILVGIVILFYTFNILFAYYSDILILKLKLETKYPRLARWIQYRKTFQHYYIGWSILSIIIIISYMIFVNTLSLFYVPPK